MVRYFFPCFGLLNNGLPLVTETEFASLNVRRWKVADFDYATLGAHHALEFSWHLLAVFNSEVHVEIEIVGANNLDDAREKARVMQAMLYLNGVSSFLMPYVLTRSINDLSGINSRDSDALRHKLLPELQNRFCTADGKISG